MDLVHLAVDTGRGPHVTPQNVVRSGGRLWLVTPRDSVKVRALRKRPSCGAVVREGETTLVVSGDARILDPLDPQSLLELPAEVLRLAPALATYLRQGLADLAGFRTSPASLLDPRVVVAVLPSRTVTLVGASIVSVTGDWPGAARDDGGDGAVPGNDPPDLSGVPDELAALAEDGGDAVIGWTAPFGPLALPGRWDEARSEATVPAALLALAAAPEESAACVTVVRTGARLDEKQGVALRGDGRIAGGAPWATLAVAVERATWWSGDEMATEPADPAAAVPS